MSSFVHYIILASVLQGTSLGVSVPPYLPSCDGPPLIAPLPLSVAPSLSSARFLPPLFPSLRTCIVPFLPHSFPFSTLPPFLFSRSHPPSHHCFLTPSRCSLPPHSPLLPSRPPSIIRRSFPSSLPYPIQCTPCVWLASCIE